MPETTQLVSARFVGVERWATTANFMCAGMVRVRGPNYKCFSLGIPKHHGRIPASENLPLLTHGRAGAPGSPAPAPPVEPPVGGPGGGRRGWGGRGGGGCSWVPPRPRRGGRAGPRPGGRGGGRGPGRR